MRKTVLFTMLLLFLTAPLLYAAAPPPDPITLKPTAKGEWSMVNPEGQIVGTLKAMDEGYAVVRTDGNYAGVVTRDGRFLKPGRHAAITSDEARLFLDTLDALKKLK